MAKRRYVKVVERACEGTPKHYVSHQLIAKKRQFELEATDDKEDDTDGEM